MRTELEVRTYVVLSIISHTYTGLYTRMVHTTPSEVLLPEDKLSKPTEKMLKYFTA